MSKKSDQVQKLLKKITPRAPLPKPLKEATLLEQGLLVVLVRHMSQDKAESMIEKLKKAYPDWNEMRVAQTQEIAGLVTSNSRRAPREEAAPLMPSARDAREYLQEVYQKTHGFDLEFLRDDAVQAGKLVTQMPFLGLAGGSFLLWIATGKQLPVHGALVRVLDRLGLIQRGGSLKKARDIIEPLVPTGEDLAFVSAFGEVADRWCDARKPICQECPLVDDCPFGKKTFQEWKVSQARLEVQRQKDEARRALVEKKEAAKKAREDQREQKRLAVEAAKTSREREKREKIEQKRREAEQREKQKADAANKKAAAEAAAAAKQAAAEAKAKAAAAKKEAAAKVAAKKEKTAKSAKAAKPKVKAKPASKRPAPKSVSKPRPKPKAGRRR